MLFLIIISAFAVGFSVNTSLALCRMAYILCAAFWLAVKGLLYLWYSEKLYSDWLLHNLVKARWDVFYFFNHIMVFAPYLLSLLWIFGVYAAPSGPLRLHSAVR
jgi:hypothetical protein